VSWLTLRVRIDSNTGDMHVFVAREEILLKEVKFVRIVSLHFCRPASHGSNSVKFCAEIGAALI